MSVLILGAFEPELTPLQSSLATAPSVRFAETGIGVVIAAARTAYVLAKSKPSAVIFVGSCGTSSSSTALLDVIVGTSSTLCPPLDEKNAFVPKGMISKLAAGEKLCAQAIELFKDSLIFSPIYTSLAITRDESTGIALATATGSSFENLELFGVATACAEAGVPWIAFSAVSNKINQAGHEEWLKNHLSAAQKTANFTKMFIEKWF